MGADMSEEMVLELVVLCSTAAGLLLLGVSKLLLPGRSVAIRLTGVTVACLAPAAGPLLIGFPTAASIPVGLVALAGGLFAVLSCDHASTQLFAGLRRLGRPGIQAVVLSAVGGGVLVASIARFEMNDAEAIDRDLSYMMDVTWKPPLREVQGPVATTDAGRRIALWEPEEFRNTKELSAAERHTLTDLGFAERLIRTSAATEAFNCHGWVFAAGKHWLSPDDVEMILADNGYQPVSQPRAGDLVIYRDGGKVSHSAVVRTAADGGPVLVEGKWGWMGVFLHPPDGSCYGQQFTYYRASRDGHLLVGTDRRR